VSIQRCSLLKHFFFLTLHILSISLSKNNNLQDNSNERNTSQHRFCVIQGIYKVSKLDQLFILAVYKFKVSLSMSYVPTKLFNIFLNYLILLYLTILLEI
jgi:hypothetical protein